MASPDYEGSGVGGKFRRRPIRRVAASTPYDRPPSAVRGARSGWLSKLVDPASRIIAGGASKIFSSVFRKPVPALPAPALEPSQPEENLRSNEEVPEDVCLNSSSEIPVEKERGDNNLISHAAADGISELEQLLKQKTFTRAQFHHLTELLHSRTIGLDKAEPAGNNEEVSDPEKEKRTGDSKLFMNVSTPNGGLRIHKDETSPAEIAKAYMGSRPSKLSPSSLSSRSSLLRGALPGNITSASHVPVVPRSVVRFPRVPEQPENLYFTPRPRGRSAIYNMSCSPYFKVHMTANTKSGMLTRDGYISSSTSSHLTTKNHLDSAGKQALKRGSPVLESDHGSFGPMRRIRQKSNLITPLKEIRSPLLGKFLPSVSNPVFRDVLQGSASSTQHPFQVNGPKYGSISSQVVEDNYIGWDGNSPHVPVQSSEVAKKILQQLDKLVPSPKEKLSELKSNQIKESPSSSSAFAIPQKQEVQENGPSPSMPVVSQVKLMSESDASVAIFDEGTSDLAVSGSVSVPLKEKPLFKFIAAEDSLETKNSNIRHVPASLANARDKQEPKSGSISVICESQNLVNLMTSSSQSMHPSSSNLLRGPDVKTSGEAAGFFFPLRPVSSTNGHQSPTPTMSTPLLERAAQKKEETLPSMFAFGSKGVHTIMLSPKNSNLTVQSNDASLNVEQVLSTSNTIATQSDVSYLDRGVDLHKAGGVSGSSRPSVLSEFSTSTAPSMFACASFATPPLNNGFLVPKTFTPFSNTAASGNQVSSIFSASSGSTDPSSSYISSAAPIFSTVNASESGPGASILASSSISTTPDKYGSSYLEAKPIKGSVFNFTSNNKESSAISNTRGSASSTLVELSAFSNADSGLAASPISSAFTSTVTSSLPLGISNLFSSTGSGSASPETSSLFSTTTSGLSSAPVFSGTFGGLPSPSPFSSTSGFFNFSSSAQPSSSFPTSISQISSGDHVGTTGSSFGIQATSSASVLSDLSQSTSKLAFASSPSFGLSGSSSLGSSGSAFGSAAANTNPSDSNSLFSFSVGADSSSSASSSSSALLTANLFSSSSQSSTVPTFGATLGSSTLSTGVPASGSSTLIFGSPSVPTFAFASAGTTAASSAPTLPPFGVPPPMNVEDTMTDDTVRSAVSTGLPFTQPMSSTETSSFMFSSPAATSGVQPVFQFGGQSSGPQTPNPFQQAGDTVGNFSLGTGAVDKSNRKIVKPRRRIGTKR